MWPIAECTQSVFSIHRNTHSGATWGERAEMHTETDAINLLCRIKYRHAVWLPLETGWETSRNYILQLVSTSYSFQHSKIL